MTARIERSAWLMELAHTVALRGTCSRLQVGALAVRGGQILSTGYNGAPAGLEHCYHRPGAIEPCFQSIHAEANAVACAARYGVSLEGATLYVTDAPCLSCAGLIINAGIDAIRFDRPYRDRTGIQRLYDAGLSVQEVHL
ncbi:deoxycytidylate deaminase [Gordonia phage Margaret]|nr:deoxycytidylate deaminase [Gordonia phage Margaret]